MATTAVMAVPDADDDARAVDVTNACDGAQHALAEKGQTTCAGDVASIVDAAANGRCDLDKHDLVHS